MHLKRTFLGVACCIYSLLPAETVTDPVIGYSVQLPAHWVCEKPGTTHHRFVDTSDTYKSWVVISQYSFDTAKTYSTDTEWTRANFIAYKILVESDPTSVLVFYDSVTTFQNGKYWAADAYSHFFDPDTAVGNYAIYIRFTAISKKGFEIYAIGAQTELDSNLTTYATIIESIVLDSSLASVRYYPSHERFTIYRSTALPFVDILGRSIVPSHNPQVPQLIVAPAQKRLVRLNTGK